MDAEQFLRLKRELARVRDEASKLQGRREDLLSRLKEEFQCLTAAEGKALLSQKQEGLAQKVVEYEELCSGIEKELEEKCGGGVKSSERS